VKIVIRVVSRSFLLSMGSIRRLRSQLCRQYVCALLTAALAWPPCVCVVWCVGADIVRGSLRRCV
jgi:hypothetical protein